MYIPAFETQRDDGAPLPWTNCNPASQSMLIDLWTYGGIDTNDVLIRRNSSVPLNQGMNFRQIADAVAKLYPDLGRLLYSEQDGSGNRNWTWAQLRTHLSSGGGAVAAGTYSSLVGHKALSGLNVNRWQPGGTFGHAVFVCDYQTDAGTVLWMDPLGHGDYAGDRIKLETLYAFIWRNGNDQNARVTAAHSFVNPRPVPRRFTDVLPTDPFYNDIEYVAEKGYMKGVSANRFDPKGAVRREQLAAVLHRLSGE